MRCCQVLLKTALLENERAEGGPEGGSKWKAVKAGTPPPGTGWYWPKSGTGLSLVLGCSVLLLEYADAWLRCY